MTGGRVTKSAVAAVGVIALTGCVSEEFVAAEMERALEATNVALAAGLVAAEVLSHVHDTPDTLLRHPGGEAFGCPGVQDWAGAADNFAVTLVYGDLIGCIPDSALVPTLISGHAGLQWSGTEATVTWDQMHVDVDVPVSGPLRGPVQVLGAAADVDLEALGTLTVGPSTVDLALGAGITAEGITFDGDATVQDGTPDPLHFESVFVLQGDIAPPCPTPSSGVVRLDGDGEEVVIDFADPGGGLVRVQRGRKSSESVDLCAYRSVVF
jgi:hypothetical protein